MFLKMEMIFTKILNNISPIRGIFEKNFFILIVGLIVPIIVGIILGLLIRKRVRSPREYFKFLLLSFIFLIPSFIFSIAYKFKDISLLYSFFFYIFYFVIIVFTISSFIILRGLSFTFPSSNEPKNKKLIYIILFLFLFLILFMNYIPYFNSKYLVGADVYYSSSKIQKILDGNSFSSMPYFFDVSDWNYPPFYFSLFSFISNFTGLSVADSLIIFSPIFSVIFLMSIFCFSRKIFDSYFAALLSVIFTSLWDKVLFHAIGPKNIAIIYLSFFLISILGTNKKRNYLLAVFFLIVTFLTHYLYFFIELIILIFSLILSRLKILFKKNTPAKKEDFVPQSFFLKISLIFSLLFYLTYSIFSKFSSNWFSRVISYYPEIPVSLFNRLSLVSVILLILFPVSLICFLKSKAPNNKKIIILSISLLILNSTFYFLNFFIFHSSIFSEIFFIFSVIPITSILISKLIFLQNSKFARIFSIIIIFALFIIGSYVPFSYHKNYSQGIQKTILGYENDLQFIKTNTNPNSIILIDPCDYLNRYLPHFTGRYVFSGHYLGKGKCSRRILTVCGSDKFGIYRCDLRNNLSQDFFENPSNEKINNMGSIFGLDFVMLHVSSNNTDKFDKISSIRFISESDNYRLYKYEGDLKNE
jgi:hypothetical protein